MMKRMGKICKQVLLIMLISGSLPVLAEGITRSTGLGFKISFWNLTNSPTRISTSGYGRDAEIDVGGVGAWINFYSRLRRNLFLEFNLGGVGSFKAEQSNYLMQTQEVSSVIPVLLGMRYDVLSERIPSSIEPYLNTGIGVYSITEIKTSTSYYDEQVIESFSRYGAYAGCGAFLVLTNWFAFNVDMRYHFVDFEFNKDYCGTEFGAGMNFMWGSRAEIFRIESIKVVVKDIYPAYFQLYNMIPIVLVSVKNTADYPIEVNIRSNIRGYSERAHETGFTQIATGETADLPIHAIFGPKLMQASLREPAVIDLNIQARSGSTHNKTMSVQVMVHSRNAWDGDSYKLNVFVTPDDPVILEKARSRERTIAENGESMMKNFELAKSLFQWLESENLHYLSDPDVPYYQDDRVQYATETLDLKTGDCDDLVVLYASLLQSLGIRTAFVDVQDPEESMAHLYLLVDTGVPAEYGDRIAGNEKRYIIRDRMGKKTVWIPVETTMIGDGFETAWNTAAMNYLQNGVLRGGISGGWFRIIDLN